MAQVLWFFFVFFYVLFLKVSMSERRIGHHLSKWQSVVTVATVFVDRLDCKTTHCGLFNADKENHNEVQQ